MPLTVLPAVNYPSPLVTLPDSWQQQNPPEGPRLIPCEVLWASMGGANKVLSFQLGQGGQGNTNAFSHINALSVDNSQCGADVQFIFSDTGETITIPAYSPKVIVPVFSNKTDFFLAAIGTVLSADITRFVVHNTTPPPLAVPTSQEQTSAAVAAIPLAVGSTQIVPAGINGTLEEGILILAGVANPAGAFVVNTSLVDGGANTLATATTSGMLAGTIATLWQVTNGNVRFSNGLSLVQTLISGAISGTANFSVNLYYRKP